MNRSQYKKEIKNIIGMSLPIAAISICMSVVAWSAGGGDAKTDPGAMQGKHFDAKGLQPSKFTIELQNGLRRSMPFDDKRDFEEAKKGFIAAPDYKQIMAEAGNVAWSGLLTGLSPALSYMCS